MSLFEFYLLAAGLLCIHLQLLHLFHLSRACLKYILLKANKTEDLACVVGCCQLSPVKVLSRASECAHLCFSHNLLVACLKERQPQRVMVACFQSEHQCQRSRALNRQGVHH